MMWTDETPQETMLNMAMHEIKTLTQTVADLRAERDRQQDIETILRALAPAARDVLWCALVWNDHNHEYRDLLDKAERAAKSLGFERSWIGSAIPQVNEWMARIDRALASPPAAEEPKLRAVIDIASVKRNGWMAHEEIAPYSAESAYAVVVLGSSLPLDLPSIEMECKNMSEFRAALQRLVSANEYEIEDEEDAGEIDEAQQRLCLEIESAKALLARPEPRITLGQECGTSYEVVPAEKLARPEPDLTDQIYSLLVRRGYAQHEAFAISHGPSPEPRITPTEFRGFNAQESEAYRSFIEGFFHGPEPRITREWQPIESAPNGVSILVAYDDGNVELKDAEDNDYQWQKCKVPIRGVILPTHWMPLPSPPAASDVE